VVLAIQLTTGLLNSDMFVVLVRVRSGQNSRGPLEKPLEITVGIKKPTQKNPPKKTQKNPPKKTH
jgi:hypothetical protein